MNTTDFPYINAIEVKDCFAYQDLGTIEIPLQNGKPFSHLILTGRNGSGKSTILKGVDYIYSVFVYGGDNIRNNKEHYLNGNLSDLLKLGSNLIKNWDSILPFNDINKVEELKNLVNRNDFLYAYFDAFRKFEVDKIEDDSSMEIFEKNIKTLNNRDYFNKKLKQFLANKKINQAFAVIDKDQKLIDNIDAFFTDLEKILQSYLQDNKLKLSFESNKREFYLNYSSGQKHTLEQSSDGLAAFLNLLINLFLRKDLIQTNLGDYTYDPPGIVLIDEPENHLHIAAQYEVMPMLTTLFPNVQFIVATHSPAVISSIKNTVVYDITSRESALDNMAGKGFTELMMTHFGLDNEFSPVGDEIINKVNAIIKENKGNKKATKELLSKVYEEEARYLSATLSLELESLILENDL